MFSIGFQFRLAYTKLNLKSFLNCFFSFKVYIFMFMFGFDDVITNTGLKNTNWIGIDIYWRSFCVLGHYNNLPPSYLTQIRYLYHTPFAAWPNPQGPFQIPRRWGHGRVGFFWVRIQRGSFFWHYLLRWFCSGRYRTWIMITKVPVMGRP